MSTVTFDTLKFANELKKAGIPDNQAEAEARALANAIGEIDVATKRDIAELAMTTKHDLAALELRMTIKVGGMLVAMTGIIIAAMKFMLG
jgi:hypothetical protein